MGFDLKAPSSVAYAKNNLLAGSAQNLSMNEQYLYIRQPIFFGLALILWIPSLTIT